MIFQQVKAEGKVWFFLPTTKLQLMLQRQAFSCPQFLNFIMYFKIKYDSQKFLWEH